MLSTSHRLRIAREHASGTGELARGRGSGEMTPAGRRAITIVVWPALPSRGCKDHKALKGLGRWMPCLRATHSRCVPRMSVMRRAVVKRTESDVGSEEKLHT